MEQDYQTLTPELEEELKFKIKSWTEKAKIGMKAEFPGLYRRLQKSGELKEHLTKIGQDAAMIEAKNLDWLTENVTPEKTYGHPNPSLQERATQNLLNEDTAKEMTYEYLNAIMRELDLATRG